MIRYRNIILVVAEEIFIRSWDNPTTSIIERYDFPNNLEGFKNLTDKWKERVGAYLELFNQLKNADLMAGFNTNRGDRAITGVGGNIAWPRTFFIHWQYVDAEFLYWTAKIKKDTYSVIPIYDTPTTSYVVRGITYYYDEVGDPYSRRQIGAYISRTNQETLWETYSEQDISSVISKGKAKFLEITEGLFDSSSINGYYTLTTKATTTWQDIKKTSYLDLVHPENGWLIKREMTTRTIEFTPSIIYLEINSYVGEPFYEGL